MGKTRAVEAAQPQVELLRKMLNTLPLQLSRTPVILKSRERAFLKKTENQNGISDWEKHSEQKKSHGTDAGPACHGDRRVHCGGVKMGNGSVPKLRKPPSTHADLACGKTARRADNKKRRYAPRKGVCIAFSCVGYPKGATPLLAHSLCEAKCSVLYALAAFPFQMPMPP